MADDPGKKTSGEEKGKEKPARSRERGAGFREVLVEILIWQSLPWAAELVRKIIGHRAENQAKHQTEVVPKHLKSFEEAMVLLQQQDDHAYQKVRDFFENGLSPEERQQLKAEAGKLGDEEPALT